MLYLYLDFETRSRLDIKVGTDRYARSAEPTVLTWALGAGPVSTWQIGQRKPERFLNLLHDPETALVAHNATFDRAILTHAWGIKTPIERWRCTMAHAYAHGLPGSLEVLGGVLGLPYEKQKIAEGRKLMLLFCKPDRKGNYPDAKSHPEEWARFLDYARNDTIALREIHGRLPAHNYVGEHLDLWHLDQRINEKGFAVDLELAQAAVSVAEKAKKRTDKRVDDLTDGYATAATQRDKILHHLVGSDGLMLMDLRASTIRDALDSDELDSATAELLRMRLEGAMNSSSKYKRLLSTAGPDSRLRYTLQYAGAQRTGRWAGRVFQPHNLIRPTIEHADYIEEVIIPGILTGDVLDPQYEILYGSPQEACANALRGAIFAAPGHKLVAADWSSIEGRMLAWLAGEEWVLNAYAADIDMYRATYARTLGGDPDELTKSQRFVGKVLDLSMGYQGGAGALVTMCAVFDADPQEIADLAWGRATEDMLGSAKWMWDFANREGKTYDLDQRTYMGLDIAKQAYRAARPATAALWNEVGNAAVYAVENPGTVLHAARCKIWRHGAWLIIELPSGRRLLYCQPKIRRDKTGRASISFMSARGKQWRRIKTYGGKLVENITQAAANDILRAAMLRVDAERPGSIVLHVHDEIVTEAPEGEAQEWLGRLNEIMCEPLPWADGLPLAAAGYVGTRYRK